MHRTGGPEKPAAIIMIIVDSEPLGATRKSELHSGLLSHQLTSFTSRSLL